MNRAVMFLLPCLPVVRRLEVRKRWWHRLSVVVFFKLLLSTLVAVAAFSYLAWAPKVRDFPMVFENFYLFDESADALQNEIRAPRDAKAIQMPDGKWSTFPWMPDEEIHARWDRAYRYQLLSAISWAALASVFATLAVNYVLQGVYRLLLYMTFDRKSLEASDSVAA
jgi:hypothetical protein